MDTQLLDRIEEVALGSGRYSTQAYLWVIRVLDFTRRQLKRDGHITGAELLDGHRDLALIEFGPMAYDVFRHWGLEETEDIGRIVFALVDAKLLSRTDEDRIEDFQEIYDFRDVFVTGYPW